MPKPESQSSPETAAETDVPEVDGAGPSALRELARQYTLDEKPETAESDQQQQAKPGESPERKKAKPKTINELAERLELDVKDLYDLEIPSSTKGEKFTLGALKDLMGERENFTVSQLKLDEDRARMEADFRRAESELQTLLSALPKTAVKPEILEELRTRHEATLKRERTRTIEVIPEWRDETRRETELAGMIEHLSGYGFPSKYLKSIFDHRTLKYMRDNYLRKQRLEKALALVGEKKPAALGKGKPGAPKSAPATSQRMTREEQQVQRYLAAVKG